jgi:hypothetical protein
MIVTETLRRGCGTSAGLAAGRLRCSQRPFRREAVTAQLAAIQAEDRDAQIRPGSGNRWEIWPPE